MSKTARISAGISGDQVLVHMMRDWEHCFVLCCNMPKPPSGHGIDSLRHLLHFLLLDSSALDRSQEHCFSLQGQHKPVLHSKTITQSISFASLSCIFIFVLFLPLFQKYFWLCFMLIFSCVFLFVPPCECRRRPCCCYSRC